MAAVARLREATLHGKAALVISIACFGPVCAVAASESNQPGGLVEEVIVTAQKREERLQDVPISISVLGGMQLDKSSVRGVTEALNLVPGVVATAGNLGGGTQISVRGVGANGPLFAGSSPIAYYLDSVPFGLVRTAIAPDSNAYDLQRIEVLRGPQGTLYGASAQNGVVRVLTNDANLDEFELKARTTVSSTDDGAGNYRGDMAVNVPIAPGKVAARAVFGYQDSSGWIDRPNRNNDNDELVRNMRLKLDAQPTQNLTVGLSAWLSRADYGAPSTAGDDGRGVGPFSESIATDYDAYGVKIGYDLEHVSISSMTSYLRYANDSVLDLTPSGLDAVLYTQFDADVFSQEVILNSANGGAWKWSAGAFYRDAEDDTFQNIPDIATLNWTDSSKSSAIFGEVGRRFFGDKLEWTLGLRYFRDEVRSVENPVAGASTASLYRESSSFHSTTPRGVLTWYPSKDLTAYASYSEGFRSGAPQAYFVAGPGFPPVEPDKLRNYEVGLKFNLMDGRVFLETAAFYIDWQDVQQQLSVPFNSVFVTALVNGDSASGVGIDFALTTRPTDQLQLGINVGWNDLSVDQEILSNGLQLFDKGDRLNYSPKYTGGASAEYTFAIGTGGFEGRFSTSANYISKQTFRGFDGVKTFVNIGDSLVVARAAVSLTAPERWTAILFADNLNNEDGGMPPVAEPTPVFSPRLRPRTLGIQVDYQF